MTKEDVLNANTHVVSFLNQNGTRKVFLESESRKFTTITASEFISGDYLRSKGFGIYVNYTCKSISIHGPDSKSWQEAYRHPTDHPNIFKDTKNGMWIGSFPTIELAYTYADLLSDALYLQTHEKTFVMSGEGIKRGAFRIF